MEYFVTGLMSGTSLDGTDLAYCRLSEHKGAWEYEIIKAETLPYQDSWKEKLSKAPELSGRDLIALHNNYGKYLGLTIKDFHARNSLITPDLVASHGHTVFHQPSQGYTFQLGHGAFIAANCQCTVVSDFRSMDVAMGGQGAPLVPLGDELLFSAYTYCLNLGGFANISIPGASGRLAFDICPVNFVINQLVREHKKNTGRNLHDYDKDGLLARSGEPVSCLLKTFNELNYYKKQGPKSLGEEWVNENIKPLITKSPHKLEDLLHTYYLHVARQISNSLGVKPKGDMLVTGGGAHNTFLIECIKHAIASDVTIIIPDNETIDFKEALIFAFLGLRYVRKETNCKSSVTGASADSPGGSIHYFH